MDAQTLHINFIVPQGWHELTDAQLRYVYTLLALDMSLQEVQVLCLLKWNDVSVVGKNSNGSYTLKFEKSLFQISAPDIAELIRNLDWLALVPSTPLRFEKIRNHRALPADFIGVPFEKFIVCDNLYQGLLAQNIDSRESRDENREKIVDEIYNELTQALYPGLKLKRATLSPIDKVNIFYWMASLKNFFAQRFSDFFQPLNDSESNALASAKSNASLLQDAMDAQIRALTKGDITKESIVLSLDTWRALTELNAQARDFERIREQTRTCS